MQIGVETSRAIENKRIFVVDSDEIMRTALQFILHDENEAHELASLEEAFAIRAGRAVDLILLGSEIVHAKGLGVFALTQEKIPGAKILLVTEAASQQFAKICLDSGADGILLKPFTVESVRQRVDAILGRRVSSSVVPLSALTSR